MYLTCKTKELTLTPKRAHSARSPSEIHRKIIHSDVSTHLGIFQEEFHKHIRDHGGSHQHEWTQSSVETRSPPKFTGNLMDSKNSCKRMILFEAMFSLHINRFINELENCEKSFVNSPKFIIM